MRMSERRKQNKTQYYRALVGLNYPTNPDVIRRILAGERVPFSDREERRVEPGEIVCDIPTVSIPTLLEQGSIEPVEEGTTDG